MTQTNKEQDKIKKSERKKEQTYRIRKLHLKRKKVFANNKKEKLKAKTR